MSCIKEREVTAQNESILTHNLEKCPPFRWERKHDSGRKNMHKRYYDGVLHCAIFAWPVEVKLNNDKLNDAENTRLALLREKYGVPCLIVRFFPTEDVKPIKRSIGAWRFELFGTDQFFEAKPEEGIYPCLSWLLSSTIEKFKNMLIIQTRYTI